MFELNRGESIPDLLAPYRVHRRPRDGQDCWVLANMVGGLDGSAAIGGRVGVLSDGQDAVLFRSLRSLADVVLVGAETVRRERYGPVRLDDAEQDRRRANGEREVPPVAVVTRSLDLEWGSPLFTDPVARSIVVTCESAGSDRIELAAAHATVLVAGCDSVDLRDALHQLCGLGLRVVLCEGGPALLGRVAAEGLLDELCLTVAPVMGGDPLPVAVTPSGASTSGFVLQHSAVEGSTLFLRYEVERDG